MSGPRRHVTFSSDAFNTSEPREYFINPHCFGDDLAHWLIRGLKERGYQADDEPGQEDFGWYFTYRVNDTSYDFVVGYRPGDGLDEGIWIGWVERKTGFLASLLGARKRGIDRNAVNAIHVLLSDSPDIGDVRWHLEEDFLAGREESGTDEPVTT